MFFVTTEPIPMLKLFPIFTWFIMEQFGPIQHEDPIETLPLS